MFRDLLIVAAVLLAMIAAVGGVVGGSVYRLWNEKANHRASALSAEQAAPQTAPSTQPVAPSPTDALSGAGPAASVEPAAPPSNVIELWARDATLHGSIQLVEGPPSRGKFRGGKGDFRASAPVHHLAGFRAYQDYAEWTMNVLKAGEYEINMNYACAQWQRSHFLIKVGGNELTFPAEGLHYETSFLKASVGQIMLPAGKTTLILRAAPTASEHPYLNLREIQLIPMFTE